MPGNKHSKYEAQMQKFQDLINEQLKIVYGAIREADTFEEVNSSAFKKKVTMDSFDSLLRNQKRNVEDFNESLRIIGLAYQYRFGKLDGAADYVKDYVKALQSNVLANRTQMDIQSILKLDEGQKKQEARDSLALALQIVKGQVIADEANNTNEKFENEGFIRSLKEFVDANPEAKALMHRDIANEYELLDRFQGCVAHIQQRSSREVEAKRKVLDNSLKLLYLGANKEYEEGMQSKDQAKIKALAEIEDLENARELYRTQYQLRKIKKELKKDEYITVDSHFATDKNKDGTYEKDGLDYISYLTGYNLKKRDNLSAATCKSVVEKIYLDGKNLLAETGFIFDKPEYKTNPLAAVNEIGELLLESARRMDDMSKQIWQYEINLGRPILTVKRDEDFVSVKYDVEHIHKKNQQYINENKPKKPKNPTKEQAEQYERELNEYNNKVSYNERRFLEVRDINLNSTVMRSGLMHNQENSEELRAYVKKEMNKERTAEFKNLLKKEAIEEEARRREARKAEKDAERLKKLSELDDDDVKTININEAEKISKNGKAASFGNNAEAVEKTSEERRAEREKRAQEERNKAIAEAREKYIQDKYDKIKASNTRKTEAAHELIDLRNEELSQLKKSSSLGSIISNCINARTQLEHWMDMSTVAATKADVDKVNENTHLYVPKYCDNLNKLQDYMDGLFERYRSGEKSANRVVLHDRFNAIDYMEKRMDLVRAENVKGKNFTGAFAVANQGEELNENTEKKFKDILNAMRNGTIDGYCAKADADTQLFINKIKYIPDIQDKLARRIKSIEDENNMSGFAKFRRSISNLWTSAEEIEASRIKSTSDFLKELQTSANTAVNTAYNRAKQEFDNEDKILDDFLNYNSGLIEAKNDEIKKTNEEINKLNSMDIKKAAEAKAKEHMEEIEAQADEALKKKKEGSHKRHHHHSKTVEKAGEEKKTQQIGEKEKKTPEKAANSMSKH